LLASVVVNATLLAFISGVLRHLQAALNLLAVALMIVAWVR